MSILTAIKPSLKNQNTFDLFLSLTSTLNSSLYYGMFFNNIFYIPILLLCVFILIKIVSFRFILKFFIFTSQINFHLLIFLHYHFIITYIYTFFLISLLLIHPMSLFNIKNSLVTIAEQQFLAQKVC